MGGCCGSARKPHIHGTPVYYYCPRAFQANESLTSHNGPASAFTAGLLFEFNLNMTSPDTFRPPPAPLPYDVLFGCPSVDSQSMRKSISSSSFGSLAISEDLDESDCKIKASPLIASLRKSEESKLNKADVSSTEEEDACPICLEEFDTQNPKLITKCRHDFHMPCILEWMARSDTCPMCDQETVFDQTLN